MFQRDILKNLNAWKEKKNRKPLVLRGARQTGKTSAVNMFAMNFDQYIYLNLEKTEDRILFEKDYSFRELVEAIFFNKSKLKHTGETLLFIDEIQNSSSAVNMLRYFYEEAPDLYVIAAGSLLESLLDKQISFPVGRVEYLAVRPCSFREYLLATGEMNSLEALEEYPFPVYAHERLITLFKEYTLVGGMPEIVSNYSGNRDLVRLQTIYKDLLVSYLDDVEKYARNSTLDNIIRYIIPHAFSSASTRITYSGFGGSPYRSREVGEAFRTLEKTMLLKLIFPVVNTRLPLNIKYRSPRLQMVDTGMVNHIAGIQNDVFNSLLIEDSWRGRIAGHIAGQELLAIDSSVLAGLNYWTRDELNTQSEIDFIYKYHDLVLPIEVKSGATGRLRSLHRFVDKAPHPYAIRIYSGMFNVEHSRSVSGREFTLVSLPFYLIGSIDSILRKIIG